MGLMRFRVFPAERITAAMIEQAYLSGVDRMSWPVRAMVDQGDLVLRRSVSDSANLHIPWPVEGNGLPMLSTSSLMETPTPYLLPLELARGTLAQVRNQLSEWQFIGLNVPVAATEKLTEAVERFSWAAVSQDNLAQSAEYAEAALRATLEAGDLLATAYADQARVARRRNGGNRASLLGADLGSVLLDDNTSRQYLRCFNAAVAPLCWRDIETTEGNFAWSTSDKQIQWCRGHGLKVFAGPLLMLDPLALPDWLYLFADEWESLLECTSTFVRQVVERYRGKVDYWIGAGRLHISEAFPLSEQERLQLVAHTVERVRSLDPTTPALVSFDQPWAEYMRQRASDFPPLQFADALLRAGLDLAGLMLEINVGYAPGGTLLRHPLELNRQLDAWSAFGLPLWLALCAPSASYKDPLAQYATTVSSNNWTPAAQRAWVAQNVPLALAKPLVQGALWNQLRDNQPHRFPHGGLFDDRQHPKPALRTLAAIRQAYSK
jgi:hypothetical protein